MLTKNASKIIELRMKKGKRKKEHKRLSVCVYVSMCLLVFFYDAAEFVAAF
jgi:hypothetical protein